MSLLPSRGPETSTAQEGELQVVGVDEDVAPIFDALSSDTARDVLNAIYEEPGTPSEIADRLDMSIQKVSYHLENLAEVDLIAVAGARYSEKGQEMTVYEPPDEPLVLFVGTEDRKHTLRSLVKRVVPTLGVLAVASAVIQSVYGGGLDLGPGSQQSADSLEGDPPAAENYDDAGGDGEPAGGTRDAGGGNGDAGAGNGDGGSGDVDATGADGDATTPEPTDAPQIEAEDVATETPAPTEAPQDTPVPDSTGTPVSEATETAADGGDADLFTGNATGDTPTEVATELARTPESALDSAAAIEPGFAFFLGGVFALALVGLVWYARVR